MMMVTVLGSPRRMLIASAALVAIAVTVLGQLLVQDAGATSIEMTVACANNSSGVMRYITPGQQCASGEVLIEFDGDPQVALCITSDNSVLRSAENGNCGNGANVVLAPSETGRLYFCSKAPDNKLKNASGPDACGSDQSVYIEQLNQAIDAVDDNYSVPEDVSLSVPAPGVLSNDIDPDGDPKSVSAVNGSAANVGVQITLASGAFLTVGVDGTVNYAPADDFNGVDSFTYTATDGTSSDTATVTITVNATNDPPVAGNPSFDAQANMNVAIAAPGLLTGANDDADGQPPSSLTIGTVGATNPAGGTISNVGADGSFEFDPPAGVTGPVTFTFDVCDADSDCTQGTATVNVAGPVIWFVDPAAASNGSGTLASPFNTLAAADAVDAAGHRIFVYSGTATSGIALNADEWLIGQGVDGASFDAVFGITPPAGTIPRPAVGGTNPSVQGNVAMANNTAVRGLNIDPASGTSGLTANSATGLTVDEVGVTTSGAAAVSLIDSGGSFDFDSVSANGGTSGIVVSNLTAGSVNVSDGAIQNTSGDAIALTNSGDTTFNSMEISNSGGSGINALGDGTATAALTVTDSSFDGNAEAGVGTTFGDDSAHTVEISGSSFTGNTIAIEVETTENADVTFDIHDNPTILGSVSNAIEILAHSDSDSTSEISGFIRDNVIGDGTPDSGSVDGLGIAIEINDSADAVIAVTGNTISNTDREGIFAEMRSFGVGSESGELDLTLTGNTVNAPDDNSFFSFGNVNGVQVAARHDSHLCVDISGNTSAPAVGSGSGYALSQVDTAVFALDGFAGNGMIAADVEAFVAGLNTGTVQVFEGVPFIENYTTGNCLTP